MISKFKYYIIIMAVLLLFVGLIACFSAILGTNMSIYSYQSEIAYLNRRITNEQTQRRILQERIWGVEDRHEQRMMKLSKQYDIWMAARRGGWRVTERLMREGAFDP